MSQNMLFRLMCVALCFNRIRTEDDLQDFEFSDPASEIMIAQESRLYQTYVKPPIKIFKPSGVTNSHRPQYNIDSEEEQKVNEALAELDLFETSTRKSTDKFYRPSYKIRAKESLIKEAVLRALERKDHVGKFAQLVPIIRSMSGSQRVALANLVASQVTTPPGRTPLNLAQVRSMFGRESNATSELMLPILLDLANLIRKAFRSGKDTRETKHHEQLPKAQMLRRSLQISEDDIEYIDSEPFDTGSKEKDTHNIQQKNIKQNTQTQNKTKTDFGMSQNITVDGSTSIDDYEDETNSSFIPASSSSTSTTTQSSTRPSYFKPMPSSRNITNKTLDLTADSTNHTLSQDLPIAEKLRSINRYLDRKGNLIRRGTFQKPLPVGSSPRRTTAEPATPVPPRRRPVQLPARKLPAPASANPAEGKCEMFTNSLCLHSEDYPTEAIVSSIRRNKAAAGALLADFRDPGEGAVDGVTAAQEAKYTAEHYLVSNRRGDTANRDFASAGEAGFMCPSTVKYARPQRARATSGQWKYIVNTGEHTQTLRLEKCLKPKESCTYLTDNFKSKCVQVYNYHRLLTWDQQNGLHMDIFKVPTCCSCHIEGYSVSFPPLAAAARPQETSSENFPEEISAEHGNGAFESVQPSIHRPSVSKSPPFGLKPLDTFSAISENHNLIPTAGFPHSKLNDDESLDSYSNSYFPDSFNQATSVRNVKRPHRNPLASSFDHVTLPSYLEPPNPSAANSFNFVKEIPSKYKITSSSQFKRGAPRPSRRPIRKKISGAPDDLIPSGTNPVESFTSSSVETLEDFNDDLEDPELITEPKRQTIAPKLQSATNTTRHEPSRREPNRHESRPEINRHESNRPDANKQAKETHINGKRINYNYHPIIDFFGDETKDDEVTNIDREDSEVSFIPPESEWKPINNPPSRSSSSGNGKRRY